MDNNKLAAIGISVLGVIFLGYLIISYYDDGRTHEHIQDCIKTGKPPRECLCAFSPNRSICL